MSTNICEECGKAFEAKTKRRVCCSVRCYKIRSGMYHSERTSKVRICLRCDKPFKTFKDNRICPRCHELNSYTSSIFHDAAIFSGTICI